MKITVFLNDLKIAYLYNYFHIHNSLSRKVKDIKSSNLI